MSTLATLPDNPMDFTQKNWTRLFLERGLNKCLVMTNDPNPVSMWSTQRALVFDDFKAPVETLGGDGGNPSFEFNIPNLTGKIHNASTYSKVVHTYQESGYDIESADIGVPGIFSVNMSHKSSHSHSESFAATEFFATSMFRVPMLRITLTKGAYKLSQKFIDAVQKAISADNNDVKYENLTKVLDQWGHYVVTDLMLGGLIYSSDSKEVTSSSESNSFSESVSVGFSANLSEMGAPVSGGASAGTGNSHTTTDSQTNAQSNLNVNMIGGDSQYIHDYAKWAGSLDGNYDSWHIINILEKTSILDLIPSQDLRESCANVIDGKLGAVPYIANIMNNEMSKLGD